MTDHAPPVEIDPVTGRPTAHLPTRQLLRISFYWLGLSSIFAGLTLLLIRRLEVDFGIADENIGVTLFQLTVLGALIAILVQPTIGAISDYTVSRWGRRKPYIFVGTVLDVVFLVGIASSNELLAMAAFIALLQFSSNVAQGPFQGYIPDLVPEPQVGRASAMVGMMQVFGNVSGFLIASIALATEQVAVGFIALGVLELITMLSVVYRVDDSRPPTPRHGRSWRSIAAGAWGTDILRERSYLWLLGSRLTILMAGGILTGLGLRYLSQSLGYVDNLDSVAIVPVVGLVALGTVLAVLPAARISDRVGRRPVIWVACAIGAIGLALVAIAPSVATAPADILVLSDDGIERTGAMFADVRYRVALIGAVAYGLSAGAFLAVDWALITDIIPKASSGRYMGISNVATASAGVFALLIGGFLMDTVSREVDLAAGPVAAMWAAVVLLGIGAVLLIPVDERPRDGDAAIAASIPTVEAPEPG